MAYHFKWGLVTLALAVMVIVGVGYMRGQKPPQIALSDALAVRTAQVKAQTAYRAVEAAVGPYNEAQKQFSDAVTVALRNAGVDPNKYQIEDKGDNLVVVPKPQEGKK